ncbi:MAG: RNA-binding domain-containing protein [Nitrososphaerota archaeon]
MIPQIDCKIEAFCEVNPSEDPQKIQQLISNVLDDAEFTVTGDSIKASSKQIESLSKIHESIQNHSSRRVYWRFLNDNLDGNETWFYLNKQAAFANSIALCEHATESPLGPIKITIHSKNIERIIEWLTSD